MMTVILMRHCINSVSSQGAAYVIFRRYVLAKLMSSQTFQKDHVDVTADQPRDHLSQGVVQKLGIAMSLTGLGGTSYVVYGCKCPSFWMPQLNDRDGLSSKVITPATVLETCMLSPSVKFLSLDIHHPKFTFKAGQWVDFFVPGFTQFSGYSICSSIKSLANEKKISLAVKKSDHPVASWVHKECEKGSKVNLRVGGNFHYDPQKTDPRHDLFLIAGGVGINPIISIFQHAADLYAKQSGDETLPGHVHLLYSAKSTEELIFKDRIENICAGLPQFKCTFFVTKDILPTVKTGSYGTSIKKGRLKDTDITQILNEFSSIEEIWSYICGPPDMLSHVESMLLKATLKKEHIKYENWY